MARLRDVGQLFVAFGQKTVGAGLEFTGAPVGNSGLQHTGRQLEVAANESLQAVDDEARADEAITRLSATASGRG